MDYALKHTDLPYQDNSNSILFDKYLHILINITKNFKGN